MLISAYWDKKHDNLPAKLLEAVHFCNRNNLPYYVAIDSNAHSSLWNDKDTDDRGILMEEFLFTNPVTLLNQGESSTFCNTRGFNTKIDLTFVSNSIAEYLSLIHI